MSTCYDTLIDEYLCMKAFAEQFMDPFSAIAKGYQSVFKVWTFLNYTCGACGELSTVILSQFIICFVAVFHACIEEARNIIRYYTYNARSF